MRSDWVPLEEAYPRPSVHAGRRGGLALSVIMLGAVTGLLASACSDTPVATPGDRHPNLLLVTLDTLRADHCSVYGYDLPTTPMLEQFAREGVRFSQAFAPTATTGPTHASLFTGLYPIAHRVVKNGLLLDESHETLAERLKAEGWQTAGITSSFVLHEGFGYAQGFDLWHDEFTVQGASIYMQDWEEHQVEGGFDQRADATTRLAVRWLENHAARDRSFFLFVHYFDPHHPYDPPSHQAARFRPRGEGETADTLARYDAEVAFTDEQLGILLGDLERMGLAEDTLVVILGDHGEGLMDHGRMAHGLHVYDEAVHVPLLARWPGRLPAGRHIAEPVELVDLPSTLLALLREAPLRDFQGRDLSAGWRGQEILAADHPVFLHRRHYEPGFRGDTPVAGEKLAVRVEGWKYIVGEEEGTRELYDLTRDPKELRNLHEANPDQADRLASRLAAWRNKTARHEDTTRNLSEEDRIRLEALGYTQ